jgi:hypothetical protein
LFNYFALFTFINDDTYDAKYIFVDCEEAKEKSLIGKKDKKQSVAIDKDNILTIRNIYVESEISSRNLFSLKILKDVLLNAFIVLFSK